MIQKPNLLPPAYLPPPPVNWPRMGIIALLLTALFAVGISGAKFYWDIKSQEAEIQNLTSALSNLSPTQAHLKDFIALQQEVDRLKKMSAPKAQSEMAWSALLADLARVMPQGLKFTEVNAEADTVSIQGTAESPLVVASYAIELRKFSWFSSVEITEVQAEGSQALQLYTFEITASLQEEGGSNNAEKAVPAKPSA